MEPCLLILHLRPHRDDPFVAREGMEAINAGLSSEAVAPHILLGSRNRSLWYWPAMEPFGRSFYGKFTNGFFMLYK